MTPVAPGPDETFRARLLAQDDAACRPWLEALPALCDEVTARWQLESSGPPSYGGAGIVLPVTRRDGRPAALKLASPIADASAEHRALTVLDGHGAVRLLDADLACGALLLELVPGPTLAAASASWDAVEAAAVAGRVSCRIADVPAPTDAQQLAEGTAAWRAQLEQQHDTARRLGHALDEASFDAAVEGIAQLSTCHSATLTHGDLSFENIMRRADGAWIAIDPCFVAGPLEHEAHTVLRSLLPSLLSAPDPTGAMADVVRAFCTAAGAETALALDISHARFVASFYWEARHHGVSDNVEHLRRATFCSAALRREHPFAR
ncbi:MAG: aminoglycoside phosphotransferase family protein [Brachybacterium tyrofermentans]|uniref:aminoglycoside phosphotransferase family protein n=1 Tax=Brachybacterium TaxID=43668 RepID=UPI003F90A4F9